MRFGGLIGAIMFAAIAAVIVLRMSSSSAPPPKAVQQAAAPQIKTVSVYVATQAIPIGSAITQEMLTLQPWPENLVIAEFLRGDSGANQVVGMVARAPFQPHEPIIKSKLANPNDPNFLAGDLPKGMRVITILTTEIEGIAGFVFPGDHVDILLTHDVDKWVSDSSPGASSSSRASHKEKEPVTETLLTNVKVLAVDQRSSNAGAVDREGKLLIPHSVSLMVSQADAQRLRLGQKVGTLTMALRALADRESSDPLTLTSQHDISQWSGGADAEGSLAGVSASPAGFRGVTIIRGIESKEMPVDSAPTTGATATASGSAPVSAPTTVVKPTSTKAAQ
jgi:pilus assembly protein CpaB